MRPALIIQNDIADRVIDRVTFKGITLLPLTTRLSGGDLRVRIQARDNLQKTSDICINESRTLELARIVLSKCLTVLSQEEMQEVAYKFSAHLALR